MKKIFFPILLATLFISTASPQVLEPVKWNFSSKKISKNIYELKFDAKIDKGWHMYGLNLPSGGPVPTSFTFGNEEKINFLSKIESVQKPVIVYDSTFEMNVELFSNSVAFIRKVKLNENQVTEIKGAVTFMACDNSRCLPPKEVEFSFKLPGTEASRITSESKINSEAKGNATKTTANPEIFKSAFKPAPAIAHSLERNQPVNEAGSLWKLFFLALLAGFGAILTPCVYPIIPLTVSFFMRDTSRSKSIFNGVFYGVSIVFIYTMFGLITGLFKIDLVRIVSSYWLANLIFFLIFLALAFSFFGLFEITLPGSLSTKIDQQADKGGFFGPFFMALATVIISFSCTGPIVGTVLGSALQGELIRPVVGMLGFSISFALPFTILAIFPGFMKSLPKSGGWLNSVKVFFAFILLAFSLVFLSNIGFKFITRDVILAIYIVIFFLLGLYLIGKIKFAHDSDLDYISVPRLIFAIAAFSFSVYLIPGMFGAPLKAISPFLPPKEEMSFDLTKNTFASGSHFNASANKNICDSMPKYSDILHMPLGLVGYFDYDEALACAKKQNKPVFVDFTGNGCKNCKKMIAEVWSDPRVLEKLQNDFVITTLFTDDWTKIPEKDWVKSKIDGKTKNTIGKKFSDLQIVLFGSNALPLYAIVDCDGQIMTDRQYYEYNPNVEEFLSFLNNGLKNFSNKLPNH